MADEDAVAHVESFRYRHGADDDGVRIPEPVDDVKQARSLASKGKLKPAKTRKAADK